MDKQFIPIGYEPVMTADRLVLALPIDALPKKLRKRISEGLKEVAQSRGGKVLGNYKKGFAQRYAIPIYEHDNKAETVCIEYQPAQPDKAKYAMRLDFNPNKAGPKGCAAVRTILKEVFGDHSQQLLMEMQISAVDWCLDFDGLSCSDVVFHTLEKQVCSSYGKIMGKNSEPETFYFGSPTSNHQIRAYDKYRELLASLAKLDKKSRLTVHDLIKASETIKPCMRLEAAMQNMHLHPSQLCTLKNPYQSVQMYSLPQLNEFGKTDFDRLFVDSVRLHGLTAALHRIQNLATRRRYVRAVAKYRVDWWNPEKFGGQLVDAIKRLGILPDAAFDRRPQLETTAGAAILGSRSTLRKLPQIVLPPTQPTTARRRR
jgi:hypothetical protein